MRIHDNKNLLDEKFKCCSSRIPYRVKDFYEYICTGDRPNGGDYYLGILNDEEWQLQIYDGRYQVNFCKKGPDGIYNPMAAMIFDPTYGDTRFAKVDSHGRADYDQSVIYATSLQLRLINWNFAFGEIGPTIRDIIELVLVNR